MHKWRQFLMAVLVSSMYSHVQAQAPVTDTAAMTLQQAEQQFLNKNLLLLAQKYNVEASRALILQAKLWSNPNLTITQGVYNPQTGKYFQTGPNSGEEAADLEQLILLAGKRNKQIKIAQTNFELSEDVLFDLLRTLKYTLRTDFFNIYFLEQSAKVYNEEISSLQQVVQAFEEQIGKGYIAETEVVRIKAQLYSLKSEYNDQTNQLNDVQSEFRLLLQQSHVFVVPQVDTSALALLNPGEFPLQALVDSANHNRSDLNIARANVLLSKQTYSYQKALAVPDLTVGVGYDKNGSYIQNFNSLSLSFDLPFFNRNQGNIRSAKSLIDYNNLELESTEQTTEEQVTRALERAIDANKLYKSIDPSFSAEFDRLAQAVLANYEKRNITILDFLDFYDSYKENIIQLNTIEFNRINAFEQINFVTGTNFFN